MLSECFVRTALKYHYNVLILVLVDHALGDFTLSTLKQILKVLILVLVDHALGACQSLYKAEQQMKS